jgi:hypothetical protein
VKVKKELKELTILESFSGISFLVLYFIWIKEFKLPFSLVVFYPILCCSFILIQGSIFWGISLWKINGHIVDMQLIAKVYRLLRWIDGGVILLYLVPLFLSDIGRKSLIFCLAVYLFSMIEYINYYYIRLSYPLPEFMKRLFTFEFSKSRIAKLINTSSKSRP